MSEPRTRRWRPDWPCRPGHQVGGLRRGAGDPTHRVVDGVHWRGVATPDGVATLAVPATVDATGHVEVRAWGSGADWLLDRVPALLGDLDDPTGFEPRHPVLVEAVRRHGVPRFGRTGLVVEALVPAVLEQKVTGQEAFAGHRALVRRHGSRAPGPGDQLDLWVAPPAEVVAAVPSWEWLQLHVDPARSRALVGAAARGRAVERIGSLLPAGSGIDPAGGREAERRLTSLPGIGEWTAAEVRRRALGDPDAVSFGDYHVAKNVGWALTGEPFDDDQLREYLEPWAGHRARVVALLGAAGLSRPRRGPRMAPRTHLPARTPGTRYPRA